MSVLTQTQIEQLMSQVQSTLTSTTLTIATRAALNTNLLLCQLLLQDGGVAQALEVKDEDVSILCPMTDHGHAGSEEYKASPTPESENKP